MVRGSEKGNIQVGQPAHLTQNWHISCFFPSLTTTYLNYLSWLSVQPLRVIWNPMMRKILNGIFCNTCLRLKFWTEKATSFSYYYEKPSYWSIWDKSTPPSPIMERLFVVSNNWSKSLVSKMFKNTFCRSNHRICLFTVVAWRHKNSDWGTPSEEFYGIMLEFFLNVD